MTSRAKYELLLLLAAALWGFAFIAQRVGMASVEPFTFTGIRFALGSGFLMVFLLVRRARGKTERQKQSVATAARYALPIGLVLFCAANTQQIGLKYTTAGKAGFITGLYVIFVPVFGIFLKHRNSWSVWAGAALASVGLYFLSITEGFAITQGDTLVLACAVLFAVQVLAVGQVSGRFDPIVFACIQFAVCAAASLAVALVFETIRLQGIIDATLPLLYGGIVSVGIAFTLQIVCQQHVTAAPAAIIMSLEAVFAAAGGYAAGLFMEGFDDEILSLRGLLGCVLMLLGMFLAQVRGRRSEIESDV